MKIDKIVEPIESESGMRKMVMSTAGDGYLIGLDFGSESARGVLLEAESGRVVGSLTHDYRHGVMSASLPGGEALTRGWALQVATDYTEAAEVILAGLGLSLGLLPKEGISLVLAGALISIALNPFVFAAIAPFKNWLLKRSRYARKLEQRQDPYAELPMSTERKYLEGQIVLVGYGKVGRRIAAALDAHAIPYVVAEQNRELVESLRREGKAAVTGNAAEPAVLIQAHIADAAMLVVALSDPIDIRQMAHTARTLNPDIEIVLRTHNEAESELLRDEEVGTVFFSEEALARTMSGHILERFAAEQSTHHA